MELSRLDLMSDFELAREEVAFLSFMKDLGPLATQGDVEYLNAIVQERLRRREHSEPIFCVDEYCVFTDLHFCEPATLAAISQRTSEHALTTANSCKVSVREASVATISDDGKIVEARKEGSHAPVPESSQSAPTQQEGVLTTLDSRETEIHMNPQHALTTLISHKAMAVETQTDALKISVKEAIVQTISDDGGIVEARKDGSHAPVQQKERYLTTLNCQKAATVETQTDVDKVLVKEANIQTISDGGGILDARKDGTHAPVRKEMFLNDACKTVETQTEETRAPKNEVKILNASTGCDTVEIQAHKLQGPVEEEVMLCVACKIVKSQTEGSQKKIERKGCTSVETQTDGFEVLVEEGTALREPSNATVEIQTDGWDDREVLCPNFALLNGGSALSSSAGKENDVYQRNALPKPDIFLQEDKGTVANEEEGGVVVDADEIAVADSLGVPASDVTWSRGALSDLSDNVTVIGTVVGRPNPPPKRMECVCMCSSDAKASALDWDGAGSWLRSWQATLTARDESGEGELLVPVGG
ncbi:hypothetical protein BSKO_02210 [Bryopsis sp. KO-2023]|nr:hypothetical protein BSKO_02210 [Bryopsis sp. KO-2023]